jgi:hypothetical protein
MISINVNAQSSVDVGSQTTSDPVSIGNVTTNLTYQYYGLYGSTEGGTTLYICGQGFDATASNNQVNFGPYPCIIPDGGATQ